jgi:hypothetical protein
MILGEDDVADSVQRVSMLRCPRIDAIGAVLTAGHVGDRVDGLGVPLALVDDRRRRVSR